MTWNIRVVKHVCKQFRESAEPETNLQLQEVYYQTPDTGDYMHGDVSLYGQGPDELMETAKRVIKAIEQPALDCKCDATKEQQREKGEV